MIVSRMHILTLLSIYILIGSMAYNANGDCYRPIFTNPYAIVLDPDQQTYTRYYQIEFSCIDGHTIFGLPDRTYCGSEATPTLWNPDPSDGLCEAQCNTINLLDDDIVVMVNGSQETLVDSRTTGQFSCRDPGQSTGPASAICTNGTFDYSDEPSCLAYCPVNLDELGLGLYYDIADDPVMDETNTLYYRNEDVITYRCSAGYEGPNNRTPTDDGTSTCNDGSWDPPGIPTCMDIDDCANHACQNGATCEDNIDSYKCQCPDGFNGIHCENVMATAEMVTTMELPTSMETTTIADQSTIALTTTKASTTEGLPTSLPNSTPPLTTRMTPTDSSTTSVVSPGLTTVTPNATSITPGLTTVTTDATTVTPDATSITPDSTTVGPGVTVVTPDATSITPGLTTVTPDATTLLVVPCGGECKATQVCNAENNCECRPDYYEDEEDTENPCKEPESIDVTIKITAVNNTNAEYKDELEDPSSPEFKKLEHDVCEPFEEIYENDHEYKGCRVLEFSEGSIIVNYVLTFAENSNQSASTVNTTVQEELQNPNGSFTGDYEFDDSSLVVAPLNECIKKIDDCDPDNAICKDQGADGYTCECREGFDDVGIPKSLPGRECMKPTDPRTTEEPQEPGLEPWKVVVGVTVPIISILTITIVGLTCWQYRRLDKTSPKSATTKMRTFPYEDDTRGSSDRRASRPESMMIMNNDGTVQEVVLPWRNIPAEEEFIFAPDNNGKGRTQMLPMVDYPSDYDGSASYGNDPLGNIVGSYDNYNYQHHDMTNSTEIDSKYF